MIERIQLLSQFFQKMSICFFASWGCHKIEVTPVLAKLSALKKLVLPAAFPP